MGFSLHNTMGWESKEPECNDMNFDQCLILETGNAMSTAAQFVNTVKLLLFFLRLFISLHVNESDRDEKISTVPPI